MKNILSLIAGIIICVVLLQYRISYSEMSGGPPVKVTTWDAFGYYMYLPAIFTYKDVTQLNWVADIDKKYSVTGGDGVQAEKQKNGNYAFKYLGGVAIMEAPLFFLAGYIARHTGYPPDGFSPPYQYTLSFGVLFYCLLAIFLLRKILLIYFSDLTAAITLLMVCLGTNFIQYTAIDNCQSHSYIFVLYVIVLYTTLKWHMKPNLLYAILTGYIIGLATISRPTEAIMVFIPIFWNTHTKAFAKEKWLMVKQHSPHIIAASIAGLIGVLPQLLYWKYATGSFIFDVGSKWDFLNPHFRVLFGWEKGWFIYTPITVFFVIGMFFIKKFPFKKSVIWFCLLNIYIVIGWHIWRYGGSYSARALMQSYAVFALPFAAVTETIGLKKWRVAYYVLCAYLMGVNLFQIVQYNKTILHYDEMNRLYYSRIYLNPDPSPIDISLLDTHDFLSNEKGYQKNTLADTALYVRILPDASAVLVEKNLTTDKNKTTADEWIKVESNIRVDSGFWKCYLNGELRNGDSVINTRIRLCNALSKEGKNNAYAFYIHVPEYFEHGHLKVYIDVAYNFGAQISNIKVTELTK